MSNLPLKHFGAAALAMATCACALAADPFPSKPIRIIVPAAPAGTLDITTRLVAEKMREKLGQPVIVENRAGADTMLGTRYVKDAPADGYTILAQANAFTVLTALKLDPGFDPVKDFTGIGMMVRAPMLMVVGADSPDRTVTDFVKRAKAQKLSYASAGVGSPPHIGAAMFLQKANLDVLHVPYRGNGPALIDVAGGVVPMIFDGYISSSSYIKGGKLRALGVTSNNRIAPLPNVPTFAEQGFDYTYSLWLGLVAPSGTPKDVVQRLSEALRHAMSNKELKDRFVSEGSEPMLMTPDEFSDYLKKESSQMTRMVADMKLEKS